MAMRTLIRVALVVALTVISAGVVGSLLEPPTSQSAHSGTKPQGSHPRAPDPTLAPTPAASDRDRISTTRLPKTSGARDQTHDPAQPVSVPATRGNSASTPSRWPADPEKIPPSPSGKRELGGERFALTDLPDCRFARELAALTPAARRHAVTKLRSFTFPLADLDSLGTDPGGGIFYACRFPTAAAEVAAAAPVSPGTFAPSSSVAVSPFPTSLKFHSRPGSTKIIYLDFGGGVINNTHWGEPTGGWNCKPFDIDSPADLNNFSINEQIQIYRIWERVSQDFAPFDVDVTTERPATWTTTTAHALFTDGVDLNGKNLPHKNSGGVAYVDVFGIADFSYNSTGKAYSPAWVSITSNLYCAEAASHEIGHNLGLHHDGTDDGVTTSTYYGGHQIISGDSHTWGPIMGGGTTPDLNQWSKGEYRNANNTEDDVAIIATKLSYLSDQAPDSITGTSDIGQPSSGTISQEGLLERTNDRDTYRLIVGPGPLSVSASTYKLTANDWGTNLDIALTLLDQSGTVLTSNNPTTDVAATLSFTVGGSANQAVYIQISPSGNGSPLGSPPTGYTSYGSLGGFRLSGTFTAPNAGPTITSPTQIQCNENQTTATTVTATPTSGTTFAITGGTDATLFAINSTSGALTFLTAPDFEQATDANTDGIYQVSITATNSAQTTSQSFSIQVLNVDESPPAFTSGTTFSVPENQTTVTTLTGTDPDGDVLTFTLGGGADRARFSLQATTGALSFQVPPDFEQPGDSLQRNDYQVTVTVASGVSPNRQQVSQNLVIRVTDVNETPPAATSPTNVSGESGGGGGVCGAGGGIALIAGLLLGWRRRRP